MNTLILEHYILLSNTLHHQIGGIGLEALGLFSNWAFTFIVGLVLIVFVLVQFLALRKYQSDVLKYRRNKLLSIYLNGDEEGRDNARIELLKQHKNARRKQELKSALLKLNKAHTGETSSRLTDLYKHAELDDSLS